MADEKTGLSAPNTQRRAAPLPGKEPPDFAKKCIESWKTYFNDYEIIKWDESNY
ncbi:MAG: capsular polysaccharide synthesis protein [Spirochaetaceae bacterium]|nr:capsular polysaccharide synthesis protein [Spirochaetaceae bacterium]